VAVIFQQVMPDGTSIQMIDEVTEEMGVDSDPPKGLVVHTHYEADGQVHVVDVWDSQDAYDTFNADRLGPATRKVAEAHGIDISQGPGPSGTVHEIHRLVRGS
jgi:hypothetical protein